MAAEEHLKQQILELIPQQRPFRFIDSILDLQDSSISGKYRFRENEFFYSGHFPQKPITPGVILIEAMAQTGVVALGIYRLLFQGKTSEQVRRMVTLFTIAEEIEFLNMVLPGETVISSGKMIYFRGRTIKASVSMRRENGEEICRGLLTGSGVKRNEW